MLLTAIWNILFKHEPYSATGYLADEITEHSIIISKKQGFQLLRMRGYMRGYIRGYIFKDELELLPE